MYGAIQRRMARSLRFGSNREMRRRAEYAITVATKTQALICQILAQLGGEVTITKGTMNQVLENLPFLHFDVVEGVNENEFRVVLSEGESNVEVPDVVSTEPLPQDVVEQGFVHTRF